MTSFHEGEKGDSPFAFLAMLKTTLAELEKAFPITQREIPQIVWDKNIPRFLEMISAIGNSCFEVVRATVPRRVFSESKFELLATTERIVSVSEYRLRPHSSYYSNVGKPIPSPENSSGPHATGIEVTLSLLRGFESRAAKHSPVLSIEFRIWGERERGAFCELLADYRRLIELGLAKHEFEFLTTCCFENIDRYTGTNAFKRLELYAANVHDPEWNFALSSSFHAESDLSEVTGALLILVVLYDACFGYCRKRKERDRILDYGHLFRKVQESS